jgi:hypothetical protein
MGDCRAMTNTVKPRAGLYLCTRTSAYGEKPCDEAFEVFVLDIDTRNCDDPKKIPMNSGTDGDWYTRGTNHRIEGGMIRRDMGVESKWAVEVADLQAFVEKHDRCIVSKDRDGFMCLEIYDDYRE